MLPNNYADIYRCNVEVIKKDIKNVYLYLLPPNGDIKITMPRWFTQKDLDIFITRKHDWIIKKQGQIRALPKKEGGIIKSGSLIPLLGKDRMLTIEFAGKNQILLGDNGILLTATKDSQELYESLIHSLYRQELAKQLDYLVPKWAGIMSLDYNYLGIKKMRTRWGSCNPKAKRLWFSLYLGGKDIACTEYVVVHELAHLIEPSHNQLFHSIVASYLPDWKARKNALNGRV